MFYASAATSRSPACFAEPFQRFLLEYDDERSGGFEPLHAMPEDRVVVLGLVTTKKPRLESVIELRRRIQEAAQFIPWSAGLSPQCGFAPPWRATASPGGSAAQASLRGGDSRLVWIIDRTLGFALLHDDGYLRPFHRYCARGAGSRGSEVATISGARELRKEGSMRSMRWLGVLGLSMLALL